ncbi:MAG TPA: ImmA/IrrE family metallo-endopeptidase [Verrucomicrobiae bacterium]
MNSQKFKEISSLAETIRETLELDVPVDLNEAVKRLGGTLSEIANEPNQPEASIRKTGERFAIYLRHHQIQARKRFSAAHELGHLFLHMGYLVDPDKWQKSNDYKDSVYHRFGYGIEEQEANLFAAAFLMPEKEFVEQVRQIASEEDLLRRLCAHFGTSASAVLRRGQELGIFARNA